MDSAPAALRRAHLGHPFPRAPLARKAEAGSEADDELFLLEVQLLKAYRAHQASQAQKVTAQRAPSRSNRAKDKIVRALRKKH